MCVVCASCVGVLSGRVFTDNSCLVPPTLVQGLTPPHLPLQQVLQCRVGELRMTE